MLLHAGPDAPASRVWHACIRPLMGIISIDAYDIKSGFSGPFKQFVLQISGNFSPIYPLTLFLCSSLATNMSNVRIMLISRYDDKNDLQRFIFRFSASCQCVLYKIISNYVRMILVAPFWRRHNLYGAGFAKIKWYEWEYKHTNTHLL